MHITEIIDLLPLLKCGLYETASIKSQNPHYYIEIRDGTLFLFERNNQMIDQCLLTILLDDFYGC